jgi:hypothetical protein
MRRISMRLTWAAIRQTQPSPIRQPHAPTPKFQIRCWLAWRLLAFFIVSGVLNLD